MSLAAKLLAIPAVVLVLAVGLWFFSGVVAPGYTSSIVLGVAWFVVASVLFGKLGKARPELRPPLRATFLACSLAAAVGFYWTSVRDTVVDEQIAVGAPASRLAPGEVDVEKALAGEPAPARNVTRLSGPVLPAGHSASGRARVVELAGGGRVLTLSDDFEIDPGPEVRVYLVPDPDRPTEDVEDLGPLKGSKGDQQYEIPAGVNVFEHRHVVFWCVPFTQTLATAALAPA